MCLMNTLVPLLLSVPFTGVKNTLKFAILLLEK